MSPDERRDILHFDVPFEREGEELRQYLWTRPWMYETKFMVPRNLHALNQSGLSGIVCPRLHFAVGEECVTRVLEQWASHALRYLQRCAEMASSRRDPVNHGESLCKRDMTQ